MKKVFFILAFLLLLFSCSNVENTEGLTDEIYFAGKIKELGKSDPFVIIYSDKGYYVIDDQYSQYSGCNVMVIGIVTGENSHGTFLKITKFKVI